MPRPKGENPPLKHFTLRIPQEVYDYFKSTEDNPSAGMRRVLDKYVREWRQREDL